MSGLFSILFLGGYLIPYPLNVIVDALSSSYSVFIGVFFFIIKILIIIFLFILVRAAFPRYRYDQLMFLGWKVILPLSLVFSLVYSSYLISFNYLPNLI